MAQISEPVSLQERTDAFLGASLHIIGVVFIARFITDISTRMVYPFIPQISAGLGVTVASLGWLIFIRSMVGVAGPVFGVWADRYGRRKTMTVGLLSQGIGVLGLALSWHWWATIPMILLGLSLAAFLPAQQAYISDQVSYQKRGRALAAVEFSWSVSAILVLPIVGWMIDSFGWRSPFMTLSILSFTGAAIVWWRLPPTGERQIRTNLPWSETKDVFLRSNVMAAVSVSLLLFVAVSSFLTVWGIWLTADFQFDAASLGWVGTGIGIAELVGVSLSSLFIDRIGKRRGSGLGLLLLAVALIFLPFTQNSLFATIAMLIITGTLFEFTIVSLIPLYSEQVPEARGTVLSLTFVGIGLGAAIGPPVTTTLWDSYGLGAVCAVATVCLVVAFGIMVKSLHDVTAS